LIDCSAMNTSEKNSFIRHKAPFTRVSNRKILTFALEETTWENLQK